MTYGSIFQECYPHAEIIITLADTYFIDKPYKIIPVAIII